MRSNIFVALSLCCLFPAFMAAAQEALPAAVADERIYEDTARCQLIAVGPQAIEIEVYGYVKTNVWADFLAIQEELYLRILGEVEAAGTALVPPAQTTYLRGLEKTTRPATDAETTDRPVPAGG